MPVDYPAVAARVLRPPQGRLADANGAVAGATDPQEAWEILATRDVIPMDWAHDARRSFGILCTSCSGTADRYAGWERFRGRNVRARPFDAWTVGQRDRCSDCVRGLRLSPAPPTVAACAAFAADVTGVASAEALAREVVAWLARHIPRARYPGAIVWRVDDDSPSIPLLVRGIDARPATGVLRTLGLPPAEPDEDLWDAVAATRAVENPANDTVAEAVAVDVAEHQALVSAAIPGADACDALLALWALGYGLDAVTAEAIVLLAPERAPRSGEPSGTRTGPARPPS